jgi:hypothetical protein
MRWHTMYYRVISQKTDLFILKEPGVHNPEDHNLNIHHCEIQSYDMNLKFSWKVKSFLIILKIINFTETLFH